jgi:hypothetical protein
MGIEPALSAWEAVVYGLDGWTVQANHAVATRQRWRLITAHYRLIGHAAGTGPDWLDLPLTRSSHVLVPGGGLGSALLPKPRRCQIYPCR